MQHGYKALAIFTSPQRFCLSHSSTALFMVWAGYVCAAGTVVLYRELHACHLPFLTSTNLLSGGAPECQHPLGCCTSSIHWMLCSTCHGAVTMAYKPPATASLPAAGLHLAGPLRVPCTMGSAAHCLTQYHPGKHSIIGSLLMQLVLCMQHASCFMPEFDGKDFMSILHTFVFAWFV